MEKCWNECLSKRQARQWLQFRWMDREWHRLLFWHEQSRLSNNEQPDSGDGRVF